MYRSLFSYLSNYQIYNNHFHHQKINHLNTLGIRTVYQGRYCKGSDWKGAGGDQYSLKLCADRCKDHVPGGWNQFIYGIDGKCYSNEQCACYCNLKDSDQCTEWETNQPYTQYAFTEPGMYIRGYLIFT